MNNLLGWIVYLLIGGAMVGFPLGDSMRECRDAKFDTSVIAMAALWPAVVGMALTAGKMPNDKVCMPRTAEVSE